MRIAAFLQLYNENENGNLIRCLNNCKQWADDIYIYDDASTDGSCEIYTQYTHKNKIIFSKSREFKKELFNKQELLHLVINDKHPPDWIGWIDGDTILSQFFLCDLKSKLSVAENEGHEGMKVHNINLWRHPAFYRKDNLFDQLWHVVFWKNNGNLHYNPKNGLHQFQFPLGIKNIGRFHYTQPLIHYGFASENAIVKKYLMYKSFGQSGWELERLIDETSSFKLKKVPPDWYPKENYPIDYDTVVKPNAINYDQYRLFNSWEEYINKENK